MKTATTQFFDPQSSVATTLQPQPPQWQSVTEQDSRFLALFPHRFDYLYAAHPDPGERPDWKTEKRHPLSDRLIQQGAKLHGVRFGKLTSYISFDVDRHSAFHPTRDPLAIQRLVAALESIGLVSCVTVTSSYSGGIHLYFPFAEAQKSWLIALVVTTLLENAGFKLKPGQLEVFPNPRPYTSGTPSLYNGHRLPLQAGSYLLNQHWEQIYTDQTAFVEQWEWAERRNDLNQETVKRVLKQAKRQRYKGVTGSAEKFLNDLNTEIEPGWTGSGQTKDLLGWIAMREYVFGHVLRGGAPITGQALIDTIREVAVDLPGYKEWCRHQHEIDKKAAEWARSIEASPKYYPYDPNKRRKTALQPESQPQNNIVPLNQARALDAEARIKAAIATLQAAGTFPSGATARADAIVALARCSNQTVHKYKALWHPDHTERSVGTIAEPITATLGNPDALLPETLEPLPAGSLHTSHPNKFMTHPAAPSGQAERHQEVGGCGGFSTGEAPAHTPNPVKATPHPERTPTEHDSLTTESSFLAPVGESNPAFPSAVTGAVAVLTPAQAEKVRQRQHREQVYAAKMQMWLASGDSILVKEAQAWYAQQRLDSCRDPASTLPANEPDETLAWPVLPVHTPLADQQALDSKTCSALSLVIDPVVCDRTDLSDVLAAIAVQRVRLGWSGQDFYDYCCATFGQPLALLDDEAVVGLLVSLQLLDFEFDQGDVEGTSAMSLSQG